MTRSTKLRADLLSAELAAGDRGPQRVAYRTLTELITAAKAKPGVLTLGVNGPATAQHLTGELFKRVAGVDMTMCRSHGGAPAVNALLGPARQ